MFIGFPSLGNYLYFPPSSVPPRNPRTCISMKIHLCLTPQNTARPQGAGPCRPLSSAATAMWRTASARLLMTQPQPMPTNLNFSSPRQLDFFDNLANFVAAYMNVNRKNDF